MDVEAGRADDAETLVFINYRTSDAASSVEFKRVTFTGSAAFGRGHLNDYATFRGLPCRAPVPGQKPENGPVVRRAGPPALRGTTGTRPTTVATATTPFSICWPADGE